MGVEDPDVSIPETEGEETVEEVQQEHENEVPFKDKSPEEQKRLLDRAAMLHEQRGRARGRGWNPR